jgi:hypothetical protein
MTIDDLTIPQLRLLLLLIDPPENDEEIMEVVAAWLDGEEALKEALARLDADPSIELEFAHPSTLFEWLALATTYQDHNRWRDVLANLEAEHGASQ